VSAGRLRNSRRSSQSLHLLQVLQTENDSVANSILFPPSLPQKKTEWRNCRRRRRRRRRHRHRYLRWHRNSVIRSEWFGYRGLAAFLPIDIPTPIFLALFRLDERRSDWFTIESPRRSYIGYVATTRRSHEMSFSIESRIEFVLAIRTLSTSCRHYRLYSWFPVKDLAWKE